MGELATEIENYLCCDGIEFFRCLYDGLNVVLSIRFLHEVKSLSNSDRENYFAPLQD